MCRVDRRNRRTLTTLEVLIYHIGMWVWCSLTCVLLNTHFLSHWHQVTIQLPNLNRLKIVLEKLRILDNFVTIRADYRGTLEFSILNDHVGVRTSFDGLNTQAKEGGWWRLEGGNSISNAHLLSLSLIVLISLLYQALPVKSSSTADSWYDCSKYPISLRKDTYVSGALCRTALRRIALIDLSFSRLQPQLSGVLCVYTSIHGRFSRSLTGILWVV